MQVVCKEFALDAHLHSNYLALVKKSSRNQSPL